MNVLSHAVEAYIGRSTVRSNRTDALRVLLSYVLEAYGDCVYNKLKRLSIASGIADKTTDPAVAARAFIETIRRLNRDMQIPETLRGIRAEDIPTLSAVAEREANPFYPVHKLMTRAELEQFYYAVMEEPQ